VWSSILGAEFINVKMYLCVVLHLYQHVGMDHCYVEIGSSKSAIFCNAICSGHGLYIASNKSSFMRPGAETICQCDETIII